MASSLTITFAHPQLSKSGTINVTDAKLLEFLDLLRNQVYPSVSPGLDENDQPLPAEPMSRADVADAYINGFLESTKAIYRREKDAANKAEVEAPGEIDA